nr:hypothetical protein [Cupriavidus gilardii]
MLRSDPVLRFLRLWLLPLLVALLPLQGWAGDAARAPEAVQESHAMLWFAAAVDDCPDPQGAGTPAALAEAAETAPSGADLAEQLLAPSAPHLAPTRSRGTPPAYAALALPDPDLPLQPRPPRG